MAEIRFDSEKELVEEIRRSKAYNKFIHKDLRHKVNREKDAWLLLEKNRRQYTRETLDQIFDKVDFYDGKKRWFGALLATPNRNLIFESKPEVINQWFETLLFLGQSPEAALNTCLSDTNEISRRCGV